MIELKVYNQKGEAVDQMEFPKILQVEWNLALVHQVVKAIVANQRQPLAHTKGRSEVRGGGKKPWRQKGTGRARHGSIRSPLWKGGGVTFGPTKERKFAQKINKKMTRKAFLSVLSKKASDGELKIMETFDLVDHKTKSLAEVLKKILGNNSAILLAPAGNVNLKLASRNLPRIKNFSSNNVNTHDLLSYKDILMDKKVLEDYKKTYANK